MSAKSKNSIVMVGIVAVLLIGGVLLANYGKAESKSSGTCPMAGACAMNDEKLCASSQTQACSAGAATACSATEGACKESAQCPADCTKTSCTKQCADGCTKPCCADKEAKAGCCEDKPVVEETI